MIKQTLLIAVIALFTITSTFSQEQNANSALQKPQKYYSEPVRFADQMPVFPGGIDSLYAYIEKEKNYPKNSKNDYIYGTVLAEFAIMEDGSVDRVSIKVSAHPLLNEEAIRIIKSLPKWTPGKVNGKPVAVWYSLPISFAIQ